MTRVTTAFAAAVALFLPIGRPLLLGLTPVVGIGAGLLTTHAAYAQTAEDWLNSGLDNAESGNLEGAIADYTKAIEIDPEDGRAFHPQDVRAYNFRGIAKYVLKDYQGAIADYTKAIEINQWNDDSWYQRGITKYVLEDYQGAIDDYTKSIEIVDNRGRPFNKVDAERYTNRGIALEVIGNLKDACMDWKKAVDLGDTRPIEWVRKQC